jgi:4-amino-4-deoxy-L-arabinose transferase-like glycosyltransferase
LQPINQEFEAAREKAAAEEKVSVNPPVVPDRRTLFLIFVGYFLLQAISRGLISETLGMDDAEQALLAQGWSWGYGPQPPLYTWLVMIVVKVIGLSSFSMALLKNVLLFGIYVLTYFVGRRVTGSHAAATAAAVALQFMPSIAYEAHRELTHSILASFIVLLTLLVFLRLGPTDEPAESGHGRKTISAGWGWYIILGMLGGLGIVSKYNYSIFLVGLALAALIRKSWRPIVLNWRAAAALVITLLIIAPNLIWMKNHPDLAFGSVGKFNIDSAHRLTSIVHGIGSWTSTSLDQVGILLVVFAILFWRGLFSRRLTLPTEKARFLLATLCCIGAIILLGIVISGATNARNRWLQPLIIPAPILVVSICQAQLNARRLKAILGLGGAVALGVAVAAPGRILLTERLGKLEGLNAPYRKLGHDLNGPLERVSMIYCPETALAGNIRIWFPEKKVTAPMTAKTYPLIFPYAVVWDTANSRSAAFVAGATNLTANSLSQATYVEEIQKYHHTRTMRLGVLCPP